MRPGPLHFVVPSGIDDPLRPSGGNTYDRRLLAALCGAGLAVELVEVEGGWPWSAEAGVWELERALRRIRDGSYVVIDGLLASRLPRVMLPASRRLRVVLLMHLPAGVADESARPAEQAVLEAASSIVTTSAWCRDWLVGEYDIDPRRVRVARPGVDPAALAPGSTPGTRLLTVGSLAPVKGQDSLLLALDRLTDLPWHWTCVGPEADATFAANLRFAARGLADRITFAGALSGAALDAAYAGADLLVVPSRHETYGMVVTEALARGIPVLAHDVGGIREALGTTPSGALPGLFVRPDDPVGLAAVLRTWLTTPSLRESLRERAVQRRDGLVGWTATAERLAALVQGAAA